MTQRTNIEPLEARIAPAITILNPLFDITAGIGKTGATIDLGTMMDGTKTHRTAVEFVTNFTPPGQSAPGIIRIELFDDKAPLTVQNFLGYVNNRIKNADYDGVIFHRLINDFVLQGGGFNAKAFNKHIDVLPTVHNEYDPTDTLRSNVTGTVAMAKVGAENGGGPHSASSEFFINLADNSANLDAQNGGFTVFGRVLLGMDVANATEALNKFGGQYPVINHPGGNTPVPKPAQFVQIVDARVIAPIAGNPDGHSFSVSVEDAATAATTDLLTSTIVNGKLILNYASGKAGVAKVKVTVSKSGETDVTDEFLVTVKPNLISGIENTLQPVIIPGLKGVQKVNLTNNGAALAQGDVKVTLYLSRVTAANTAAAAGYTLDASDIEIGTFEGGIAIPSGKTSPVSVNYLIPESIADAANYRLLAKVETLTGTVTHELFTDDNLGNSTATRDAFLAFGSIGKQTLTFNTKDFVKTGQPTGDDISISLTGGGFGKFIRNANTGLLELTLNGTTPASKLTIKTAKGVVADIQTIDAASFIGSLNLANTHIHSHVALSGGAKSVITGDLGDAAQGTSDFSIGAIVGSTQKTKLTFGTVRDFNLTSDMPVTALKAAAWLNSTTGSETITLAGLGAMSIAGDFAANLEITSVEKTTSIAITGALSGSTIRTAGDLAKLTASSITDSNIFAGVSAKPTSIGDLAAAKNIGSIAVTGTFSNSNIAAALISSVSLKEVTSAAGSGTWGIYADAIKSYVRALPAKHGPLRLDLPGSHDPLGGNYEVLTF